MPISGCHDLPLATFNLPSRNGSQSNRKRIPTHPADWGEGLIRCAGRPQEWSFGAVPPQDSL